MDMTSTPDWTEANSLVAMLRSPKPASIVVDPSLRSHSSCNTAQTWLRRLGLQVDVHEVEPIYEDHQALRDAGRDLVSNSSLVVALGGGATIDWAKLAVYFASTDDDIVSASLRDRCGIVVLSSTVQRKVPLVVVPTTFGTGAEVSTVSVYTGAGDRRLMVSKGLIPDASVIDEQALATLPTHMIAEGILEILARLSNPYVDETGDIGLLSDDIVETLLARLISLVTRPGFIESPDSVELVELARISRASHDRCLARITNRVPLLWALSNELVAVTGLRKMEVSWCVWQTLWAKILSDGGRYGSTERLRRLWQIVIRHSKSDLSPDPVEGLRDLGRLLQQSSVPPTLTPDQQQQGVSQAQRRWGAGLPFLRGLSHQEIDRIITDSFTELVGCSTALNFLERR